jgi:AcrR family transcriptional regulator
VQRPGAAKAGAASRQPLTRRRVLEAALAFIDAHGLVGLSMRKLGAELGVEAMSLYNHVEHKAALLDGVVELVLGEIELPGPEVGDWRERLRVGLHSLRRVAKAHPNVIMLLMTRNVRTAPALAPIELALELLCSAGLDDTTAVYAFHTLTGYVFGCVLHEVSGPFGNREEAAHLAAAYRALPADQFPRVVALAPLACTRDADAEFDFGLEAVLAGLQAHLGR